MRASLLARSDPMPTFALHHQDRQDHAGPAAPGPEPASPDLLADPAPPGADQARRRLALILPVLVAVFGALALASGAGAYLSGAGQDGGSLALRLALVAAALGVCPRPRLQRPLALRAAGAYLLVAAALAPNSVSLAHGLRQAAPALVAWLACAGFADPRPRNRTRMLAPTLLLYGGLSLFALPWRDALFPLGCCAAGLALAGPVGAAVRKAWRMQWLRERALLQTCRYDSLSGALSRNYLLEQASRDFSLARRHGRPFSVAMLDLDHFKCINDRHGHAVGDSVIRALVAACSATLRATDYVGRIGGEEFVCVMPETAPAEALACAERIRERFASQPVAGLPAGSGCTVSIGIAVYAGQADLHALLREADMALYRAKEGGRNRTMLSGAAHLGAA